MSWTSKRKEAAILHAVGTSRVDLLVEDTGDPQQLGRRLAGVGGMPAVHVSCHGLHNWPLRPGGPGVPVLMMENDVGEARPTTAAELTRLLTVGPQLLFVSACLTATGADAAGHLPPGDGPQSDPNPVTDGGDRETVAHSLVTALVTAGVPAVIGWDGLRARSRGYHLCAAVAHRGLADRADVAVAVGDARRALLESDDPVLRAEWHLARLWLGPAGGGPLVAGTRKRSLVSATHGTKTFLDRKRQVPVATSEMFVGRRPQLQQALRALRSGERAGVLLHGQGRLGKSSLAARIADRCPDRAVAVVFGDYSALAILDAVADAVRTNPAARDLITQQLPRVRERPEAVEGVLVDLLAGPCAQAGDGQRPLLLVIDDLEQILVADPDGPHRVAPEHAAVLAAVIRAFDPAETDSRLLLTSRFTFRLDGLEDRLQAVHLPPLSTVAQRKLQRRHQALTPTERQNERAGLAARAVAVSRGNPGLQDLIGLRLVYGEQVPVARAQAAVAEMEAYLHQGELPSDAAVRAFLENLALDTLVREAGPTNRDLLRAATLFDLPVPEPVIAVLADQVGGSPARLRGLGLLEPYPDLYDPARLALAVNPLAAGRLPPLTPSEQAALAAVSVSALLTAWGGSAPEHGRASGLDGQLTRLGLLGDNPTVVAACAVGGVYQLRGGRAEKASRLGRDAIALLDRHHHAVPLFRCCARPQMPALTSGDGDTVGRGAAGASRWDRWNLAASPRIDPLDQARVPSPNEPAVSSPAGQLCTRPNSSTAPGPPPCSPTAGSERRAATGDGDDRRHRLTSGGTTTRHCGSTARCSCQSSNASATPEKPPSLGAASPTSPTIEATMTKHYGSTARCSCRSTNASATPDQPPSPGARSPTSPPSAVTTTRHYGSAGRMVQLPVYERARRHPRSTAITWGKIADITSQRGDYDEALRIHRDGAAAGLRPPRRHPGSRHHLGQDRGHHLPAGGLRRGAADPPGHRAAALRTPRRHPIRRHRLGQDRRHRLPAGGLRRGAADPPRWSQLPVFGRLGDTRETAITWGQIADITSQRGDYDEALRIHRVVQLAVFGRLGDTRSTAITWGNIADILFQRGDYDEAMRIRREVQLPVYEHLGDTRENRYHLG